MININKFFLSLMLLTTASVASTDSEITNQAEKGKRNALVAESDQNLLALRKRFINEEKRINKEEKRINKNDMNRLNDNCGGSFNNISINQNEEEIERNNEFQQRLNRESIMTAPKHFVVRLTSEVKGLFLNGESYLATAPHEFRCCPKTVACVRYIGTDKDGAFLIMQFSNDSSGNSVVGVSTISSVFCEFKNYDWFLTTPTKEKGYAPFSDTRIDDKYVKLVKRPGKYEEAPSGCPGLDAGTLLRVYDVTNQKKPFYFGGTYWY